MYFFMLSFVRLYFITHTCLSQELFWITCTSTVIVYRFLALHRKLYFQILIPFIINYLKVLFDPIYVSEKSESRYMDLGDLMDFFFWRWTIDGNQLYIDYLNFREFHIYIYYRETLLLHYHMTRVSINNVKALWRHFWKMTSIFTET